MQYWSWSKHREITNAFSNPTYPPKNLSPSDDNKVVIADNIATIGMSRDFTIEEPNYHFLTNYIKGLRSIDVGENDDVEFKFNLSLLSGAISNFTFGLTLVRFLISEFVVETIIENTEDTPSYIGFGDFGSIMDESGYTYGCSFLNYNSTTGEDANVDLAGNPGDITIKREDGVWTFNGAVFDSPISAVKYLQIDVVNWHLKTDYNLGAADIGTYKQLAMPESTSAPAIPLTQVAKPTWTGKVITWQDVPNAESYKVKLYNANSEALDTQTVVKGTQRYDFTDLIENYLPAGSYQATVQALP